MRRIRVAIERCAINRFGLSPPHIVEQAAFDEHVAEKDVFNAAFIAVLNADAAIARSDDAVIKYDVTDRVDVFAAELDRAGGGNHGAIGDRNVFAWAKFRILPAILQANAIIA